MPRPEFPCQTGTSNGSTTGLYNATVLPPCGGGDGSYSGSGSGSGRPGGGRSYYYAVACGSCNAACIYKAIEMGFVIGIIANILVITRVIFDRKLRDSTFVAIAALAIADLLFLSIQVTLSFENVFLIVNCSYPSKIIGLAYYILNGTFWFAANAHISLLAILRYVMLTYPLKANIILTPKRVMTLSAIVWVIGSVLMGSLTLLIRLKLIVAGKSREFVIYLWSSVYLMPLVITIVLHLLKVRKVKKRTKYSATEVTQKAIQRMSKIVVMVIICAAILPFPRLLEKILRAAGHSVKGDFGMHYTGIAHLLFLINNFINPFVYGFMSPRFRTSLKEMMSCWPWFKLGSAENSVETTDTPLSSRKKSLDVCLDRLGVGKPPDSRSLQTLSDFEVDIGTNHTSESNNV